MEDNTILTSPVQTSKSNRAYLFALGILLLVGFVLYGSGFFGNAINYSIIGAATIGIGVCAMIGDIVYPGNSRWSHIIPWIISLFLVGLGALFLIQ